MVRAAKQPCYATAMKYILRAGNTSKEEGGMVWEKPVFLDGDITVSEICTLLHVAGLFPATTTMDNSMSGTCSINGLIAVLAVV
jgi:hypothetical protein